MHNAIIPSGCLLANPLVDQSDGIDVILGADVFWNLLKLGKISLGKRQPTLFNTKLGWIVTGKLPSADNTITTHVASTNLCQESTTLESLVENFWNLETFDPRQKPSLSREEQFCEVHFQRCSAK